MSTVLHREGTVSPDGKIEISVPELQPGQHVKVTIEPEQTTTQAPTEGMHVIDIVKDLPGHRVFKSAEEVDEYLRQERESWDR